MNFAYSLEEWLKDWDTILEASLTISKENLPAYLDEFFRSRYTNPDEALWKRRRLVAAWDYLLQNKSSFEAESWVIQTSEEITFGRHLTIALYRFFGFARDEKLNDPPPPKIICIAAEEQYKPND